MPNSKSKRTITKFDPSIIEKVEAIPERQRYNSIARQTIGTLKGKKGTFKVSKRYPSASAAGAFASTLKELNDKAIVAVASRQNTVYVTLR